MHYYKKNIGDYAKKTGRLSMLQHGSYTLLIDACYDREQFPTMEQALEWTWASTKEEIEAVEFVLKRFFTLVDGVYVQNRIQEEIDEYRAKASKNKEIALEREANRKRSDTNRARTVHETPPNQEPITNNHKPSIKENLIKENPEPLPIESPKDNASLPAPLQEKRKSSLKGTRIPEDWVLRFDQVTWALNARPDLKEPDVYLLGEGFKDFWLSKSGNDAVKVDWNACWRTWVRNDLKFHGMKKSNGKPKFDLVASIREDIRRDEEAARAMGQQTTGEIFGDLRGEIYENGQG